MTVYSNTPYTITTSVGNTYSVTIPTGGSWLTLRNDGSIQQSGSGDGILHVLVMNLTTGPVPNATVNVNGNSALTGSDGICTFPVVDTTPPPPPPPYGPLLAFGLLIGVTSIFLYFGSK